MDRSNSYDDEKLGSTERVEDVSLAYTFRSYVRGPPKLTLYKSFVECEAGLVTTPKSKHRSHRRETTRSETRLYHPASGALLVHVVCPSLKMTLTVSTSDV